MFQRGGLEIDRQDPGEPSTGHLGPDPGVVGQHQLGGAQVGLSNQVRDLVVVAGEHAVQVDVGPVHQVTAFGHQVVSVVEQRAQVRGVTDGQPDRWQVLFAHRDPGDRDRVDGVGLALAWPGAAFPRGHQCRHFEHPDIGLVPVQRQVGGDASAVVARAFDPDPGHVVFGQQLPDPDEPGPGVRLVRPGDGQADLVDHGYRQCVLVRIDTSEHSASLDAAHHGRVLAARMHLWGGPHASIGRHRQR